MKVWSSSKSAYTILGRLSIPGVDCILAIPQDNRTKSTQCPPEPETCIEDQVKDATYNNQPKSQ
jgi:hypothetical protein